METFFVQIAKLLALPSVMSNLKRAEKIMDNDPELQSYIDTAQFHLKQVKDRLPDYCKRHPNSQLCKTYIQPKK